MFKVERSELEGRFNPYYHQPKFKEISRGLAYSQYEIKAIGDITTKISGGATPTAKSDAYTTENDGIPFLRIQNITEEGIDLTDVEYITKETHNKLLKRSKLFPNDILFTITGRIGTTTVVPDNFGAGNINQHIVRMSLREGINPYYVATFLNSVYGKVQEERKVTGTTRIALDYPAIKSIKIPIPPCPIQDKIAQIRRDAYKQKKERFREAEDLLAGINDYVLDRLGIEIPEVEEKKTFVVTLKYLKEGKRHDVLYYQPKFKKLMEAVENNKYEVGELGEAIGNFIKGNLPKHEDKGGEAKILQIRNITLNGNFDLTDILTAKSSSVPRNTKLKKGELIFVITGATIGKIAVFDLDEEVYLGGDMVKTDVKNVNPLYLLSVLLSPIGQMQINQHVTGATNKHLSLEDIKSIKIPIPPIRIQNEIAEEVKRRMDRGEELKNAAEEVVKLAKEKVERMILGEEK
jgi:restriction endonuclease S subunit